MVTGDLTDWGTPPELESFREAAGSCDGAGAAHVRRPRRQPGALRRSVGREARGTEAQPRAGGDPADRAAAGGRQLHPELRGGPRARLVQLRPGRPALRPLSQRGELLVSPRPGAEAGLAPGRSGGAARRPGGGPLPPHPPALGLPGPPERLRRAAGPARALALEQALRPRPHGDRRHAPYRHRGPRHPPPGLPSRRLRGRGAADRPPAAGPGRFPRLPGRAADHAGGGQRTSGDPLDAPAAGGAAPGGAGGLGRTGSW